MPWAMSAATAASAVVIGMGAAIGSGLGAGSFALGVAFGMVRSVQIEGLLSRPAEIELFVPPFLTSAAPHVPFRAENRGSIHYAPLPYAYLRRAARKRHRQGGAAVRLVPPHPRSRRPLVHRPARPLRHHPGGGRSRFALLQGGGEAALGVGGADRRQG